MAEPGPTSEMTKSWSFFEKAHKAGEASNFDYAIDMYLEGLRLVPEEIVDGHNRLRALALHAQGKGRQGAFDDGKGKGNAAQQESIGTNAEL